MSFRLLIINPGSTSTKLAIYEDETPLFTETLRHSAEEIKAFPSIAAQKDFRRNIIVDFLAGKGIDLKSFDAVVGRGGLLKLIPGGTYAVNDALVKDLEVGFSGQHASNLGGILAREIAREADAPAYIVDPPVVDERMEISKISGIPSIERRPLWHALNQKAVARRYASEHGKRYEEVNVVVAHMGGGVTVGAHCKGLVVDVNNGLTGEGPMSPERAGTVPAGDLADLCFSGKLTKQEIDKLICGRGGMVAHLGVNDMREVEAMAETDAKAAVILDAFCYQVAKAIGEYAVPLKGQCDAIILTGGIAYSKIVTAKIAEYAGWIAPVILYPGEDEMLALAQGGLRCLKGEEKAKDYQ